jgi:lysozyme family protein
VNVAFELAFDRLMAHEGGYANDPSDPGGETKYGISKRSYPQEDIPNMTPERAKAIFRRDFWERVHADALPTSVAFQLSDFAYHSGPETAVRYLQRALGVADDGHWGPVSQAAAARTSEGDMIMRLNAERLDFMTRRSNWPSAGKGWARRIANNLRHGAHDTEG